MRTADDARIEYVAGCFTSGGRGVVVGSGGRVDYDNGETHTLLDCPRAGQASLPGCWGQTWLTLLNAAPLLAEDGRSDPDAPVVVDIQVEVPLRNYSSFESWLVPRERLRLSAGTLLMVGTVSAPALIVENEGCGRKLSWGLLWRGSPTISLQNVRHWRSANSIRTSQPPSHSSLISVKKIDESPDGGEHPPPPNEIQQEVLRVSEKSGGEDGLICDYGASLGFAFCPTSAEIYNRGPYRRNEDEPPVFIRDASLVARLTSPPMAPKVVAHGRRGGALSSSSSFSCVLENWPVEKSEISTGGDDRKPSCICFVSRHQNESLASPQLPAVFRGRRPVLRPEMVRTADRSLQDSEHLSLFSIHWVVKILEAQHDNMAEHFADGYGVQSTAPSRRVLFFVGRPRRASSAPSETSVAGSLYAVDVNSQEVARVPDSEGFSGTSCVETPAGLLLGWRRRAAGGDSHRVSSVAKDSQGNQATAVGCGQGPEAPPWFLTWDEIDEKLDFCPESASVLTDAERYDLSYRLFRSSYWGETLFRKAFRLLSNDSARRLNGSMFSGLERDNLIHPLHFWVVAGLGPVPEELRAPPHVFHDLSKDADGSHSTQTNESKISKLTDGQQMERYAKKFGDYLGGVVWFAVGGSPKLFREATLLNFGPKPEDENCAMLRPRSRDLILWGESTEVHLRVSIEAPAPQGEEEGTGQSPAFSKALWIGIVDIREDAAVEGAIQKKPLAVVENRVPYTDVYLDPMGEEGTENSFFLKSGDILAIDPLHKSQDDGVAIPNALPGTWQWRSFEGDEEDPVLVVAWHNSVAENRAICRVARDAANVGNSVEEERRLNLHEMRTAWNGICQSVRGFLLKWDAEPLLTTRVATFLHIDPSTHFWKREPERADGWYSHVKMLEMKWATIGLFDGSTYRDECLAPSTDKFSLVPLDFSHDQWFERSANWDEGSLTVRGGCIVVPEGEVVTFRLDALIDSESGGTGKVVAVRVVECGAPGEAGGRADDEHFDPDFLDDEQERHSDDDGGDHDVFDGQAYP